MKYQILVFSITMLLGTIVGCSGSTKEDARNSTVTGNTDSGLYDGLWEAIDNTEFYGAGITSTFLYEPAAQYRHIVSSSENSVNVKTYDNSLTENCYNSFGSTELLGTGSNTYLDSLNQHHNLSFDGELLVMYRDLLGASLETVRLKEVTDLLVNDIALCR